MKRWPTVVQRDFLWRLLQTLRQNRNKTVFPRDFFWHLLQTLNRWVVYSWYRLVALLFWPTGNRDFDEKIIQFLTKRQTKDMLFFRHKGMGHGHRARRSASGRRNKECCFQPRVRHHRWIERACTESGVWANDAIND